MANRNPKAANRAISDQTKPGANNSIKANSSSGFTSSVSSLSQLRASGNAPNVFGSSHGDTFASSNELEEFVGNKIEIMKRTETAFHRAAVLGCFVPDCVVRDERLEVPYLRKFEGVVFMTDISGFTALTEAYSLNGKGGTEQLTKTLANYMGPLAECILRTEGDIIKYAGDAFLSVWKVNSPDDFPELLQKVIDCALYCQEKYGSYVTDVNITIKVKIGIGAGIYYASSLGNRFYHHYAVYGPGVEAASSAEHQCVSGDVILHGSAWQYLNPKHFSFTTTAEANFYKVTDIVRFINPSKRGRPIVAQRLNLKQTGKKSIANPGNISGVSGIGIHFSSDIVRPILEQEAISGTAEERLRKYVIPPVLKKLDDDMPLDYLNESRMVSIVFIHIDYAPFENDAKFGQLMSDVVQACFLTILKSATDLNGCLTKVIMFDKGLTYLVVFGLPGYIQDNQTANSLTFAYRMGVELKGVPKVTEVSIGCTTGATYCGILGHPRRHEYTVIGKQVNKAARLMCYYPGKVTCSQDSFYSSKQPPSYFVQLESKALKGISNVGKIYEYIGAGSASTYAVKKYEFPILGRKHERELVVNNLRFSRLEFEKTLAAATMSRSTYDTRSETDIGSTCAWMTVIEGENGIGKTRFLSALISDAEKLEWTIFTVALSMQHASQNLYTVENLLTQALGMEGLRNAKEREEHLRRIAAKSRDVDLIAGLSALNEIFHLKLPTPQKFAYADANARHVYAQHMIVQLVKQAYPRTMILFCVEDAHYMSKNSWEYLNYISRLPSIRTLMTLRRNPDGLPRIPDIAYKICYHSTHVTTIRLQGLQNQYILPLACQILEVRAIPAELEKIIMLKSQGNPTWVEDVLNELLAQDKIKIVDFPKGTKLPKNMKLSVVAERYIRKEALNDKSKAKAIQLLSSDYVFVHSEDGSEATPGESKLFTSRGLGEPELRICLIKSNTNIHTTAISGSLKEKLLDLFDSLNTNDQMLVKCACVLGTKFSHSMLNRLLPLYGRDAKKYLQSFRHLMEERIFSCASKTSKDRIATGSTKNAPVSCYCGKGELISDNFADDCEEDLTHLNLPSYCYCKYVEFSRESMVEVVYELLTEDLKRELHFKTAKHLETTAIQCPSCGGPQTTYVYGFVLKTGAEDEEEGITAAGAGIRNRLPAKRLSADTSRRNLQASLKLRRQFSEAEGTSRRGTDADNNDIEDVELGKQNKSRKISKPDLTTRLNEVRRTLETGGGQLASVELEILNTLLDVSKKKKGASCCRKKIVTADVMDDEEPYSQNRDNAAGRGGGVMKRPSGDQSGTQRSRTGTSVTVTSGGRASSMSFDEQDGFDGYGADTEEFDLRGCQCTAIQARVCQELVKHYRKAEKYGKCITYLLNGAESSVTIGNCIQALGYVEEASELLNDINDGKIGNVEDPEDTVIIEKDINRQISFLNGICFYEMGSYEKSKASLIQSLKMMKTALPGEGNKKEIQVYLKAASFKLWRIYHSCGIMKAEDKYKKGNKMATLATIKIRALSYLQKMYKDDGNESMALLTALMQVILSEKLGGFMEDVIPGYCNMMEVWTWIGKHKKAIYYEEKALNVARAKGFEYAMDALGLLTMANMFLSLSNDSLRRGEFKASTDDGYLSLRISNILHDTTLTINVLPTLIRSLMFTLQLSELIEALHNLWYLSQSEDHWTGTAGYFCLVMDMILELCCPVESFYYCEQFVTGKDWNEDIALFREFEIQFSFEASLTLWYTRYSKWDEALTWRSQAELHRPKSVTLLGVSGTLKLLECYLISANFHQQKKRFQLFASDREQAKKLIRDLRDWVNMLPVFQPRFYHMLAYYSKIRDRKRETEYHLKRASKIAKEQGNRLEEEYVKHTRLVWSSVANPTVKYFWLEHTEKNLVDWHTGSDVPWANIMYSLPVPAWS